MYTWKCWRTASICASACLGSSLRKWDPVCIRGLWHAYIGRMAEALFCSFSLQFWIFSLLYAILTHLFVIFASEHHCILLFIFILALKTLFFIILLVGEAPIWWWSGTTFLPLKLRPISGRRVSSLSLAFSGEVRECYLGAVPHWEVVGYYPHLSYCWVGDDSDSLWLLPHDWP